MSFVFVGGIKVGVASPLSIQGKVNNMNENINLMPLNKYDFNYHLLRLA